MLELLPEARSPRKAAGLMPLIYRAVTKLHLPEGAPYTYHRKVRPTHAVELRVCICRRCQLPSSLQMLVLMA